MFKIDIHTHILPENLNEVTNSFSDPRFLRMELIDDQSAMLKKDGEAFRKVDCNCWNHQKRIQECDTTRVDVQVLSTIPVLFSYWAKDDEGLMLSRFLNDHIAKVVRNAPKRFIGLGTVPMQNIDLAIEEMDRCITKLNLPGIEIGSNVNGRNLSEAEFQPIFEHAEKIGCAIFVHPWEMMGQSDMDKYWLPWLVGMPAETSRAICSMIFGGIFKKFPNLRIAFAHGGGSFPYTLGRIEQGFLQRPDLCSIDNNINPREYLNKFYVDSLVHSTESLQFLVNSMGINQIALGTDYPFPLGESNPGNTISSLDSISKIDRERLFSGTALEWLNLDKNQFI